MSHAAAASPWQQRGGREGGLRVTLHRRNFPDRAVTARAQSSSRADASCRLQVSLQVLDLIQAGASQGKLGNSSWKQSVH